ASALRGGAPRRPVLPRRRGTRTLFPYTTLFRSQMFRTRPRESRSLGSGVIVESSGVILTNSHVINGATDIRIAQNDGREFAVDRSEEHTSELQSRENLVCRLLLENKNVDDHVVE